MSNIKTRETHKDIKVLDKSSVAGERMKNAFIRSKDTATNLLDDGQITPEEYAEDRVQYAAEDIVRDTGHTAANQGKRLVHKGRKAIREHRKFRQKSERDHETPDSQAHPSQDAARQRTVRQAEAQAAETQNAPSGRIIPPDETPQSAANTDSQRIRKEHNEHSTKIQSKESTAHAPATSQGTQMSRSSNTFESDNAAVSARRSQGGKSIKTAEKTEKTIKHSARSTKEVGIKVAQKTTKSSQKAIKTSEYAARTAIKTTQATAKTAQKTAQASAKAAQKAAQAARAAARAAAVTAKAVAKAVAAAVKAIIAAAKELIAAIAAGGWIAIIAIVMLCLIGLIIISPFGIFFSGSNKSKGAITASAAVAQINYDFNAKLESMQSGDYNEITVYGSMADWPEVLSVFAVKVAGSNDADMTDVATLDAKRVKKLKTVFWDMNTVTSEVKTIEHPDSNPNDEQDDSWTERILQITLSGRTAEEMKTQYSFSEDQKTILDELLGNRDTLLKLIGDLQYISNDANDVMRRLPDNLSEERRTVIKTACSLVGKVGYFWGGKSLVIGWDSSWGSIQRVWAGGSPTTGTYRPYGLDCSGFVDWVFYNASEGSYVIGHGGGAEIQHSYCRSITWDEALPGDLVFYPDDEHVGIVACRDKSGDLMIIHCASGKNCVVVTSASGFTDIGRPFYYTD